LQVDWVHWVAWVYSELTMLDTGCWILDPLSCISNSEIRTKNHDRFGGQSNEILGPFEQQTGRRTKSFFSAYAYQWI